MNAYGDVPGINSCSKLKNASINLPNIIFIQVATAIAIIIKGIIPAYFFILKYTFCTTSGYANIPVPNDILDK